MKNKNRFIAIGIIGGIVIIGLLYFAFMFFAAFGGLNFLIHVPKPEITYGEFPFCLTYELDDEIKVIEDTIICEFDGFEVIGESGKYRKWKTSLKSENEQLTLLDLRPSGKTNELGQKVLELYFYYGSAAYYMGDNNNPFAREAQGFDYVSYEYQTMDGKNGKSGYDAEEAYEKFKIRLINWEVSEPIQNKFK